MKSTTTELQGDWMTNMLRTEMLLRDLHFQPLHTLTELLLARPNPSVEDRAYLLGLSVEEADAVPELHRLLHGPMSDVKSVVTSIRNFAVGGKNGLTMSWPLWLLGFNPTLRDALIPVELDGVRSRLRAARVGEWLTWSGVSEGFDLVPRVEADATVADAIDALWERCEQESNAHKALVEKQSKARQALVAKIAGK